MFAFFQKIQALLVDVLKNGSYFKIRRFFCEVFQVCELIRVFQFYFQELVQFFVFLETFDIQFVEVDIGLTLKEKYHFEVNYQNMLLSVEYNETFWLLALVFLGRKLSCASF